MRFMIASIFFIVAGFIFFAFWAFTTFLMDSVDNALTPMLTLLSGTSQSAVSSTFNLIQTGFGIFAVLFFLVAILLAFFADSWRSDPETYYRKY